MDASSDRTRWEETPIVFIPRQPRPVCPRCGSERQPKTVRSEANRDGSQTRKSECVDCGERFKIVVE